MNTRSKHFVFKTAAAFLTLLIILFGGVGATAFASQSALPGDALYPVKTSLEQTQIALARDAYQRALLHLDFAQRRLDEMNALVGENRYTDIEKASNEFEDYVQRAIDELQVVMTADSVRGTDLSNRITQALLSYSMMLKNILVKVPEAVRPTVEKAITTSVNSAGEETEFTGIVEAIADDSWTISGQTVAIISLTEIKDVIEVGDTVKVEAIIGADGSLTAREIELSDDFGEDNGNFNDNQNDNADDDQNQNDNGNANDDNFNDNDDNGNMNDNDDNGNMNDNDDNGNMNDNDDNGNMNDNDDNGNQNDNDDNGNMNDNDDNGNQNDNDDNGNMNDNDDNGNQNDNDDNGNMNDNDDNGNQNDNDDNGNMNDNNDNGNQNDNDDNGNMNDNDDNGNMNDNDDNGNMNDNGNDNQNDNDNDDNNDNQNNDNENYNDNQNTNEDENENNDD